MQVRVCLASYAGSCVNRLRSPHNFGRFSRTSFHCYSFLRVRSMTVSKHLDDINPTVRDFQPIFANMVALGLWVGNGSGRLVLWKVVIWALLIGYIALWCLQTFRHNAFFVDVRLLNDIIGILSALTVQFQMQKYSCGLAAVVRSLGPRKLVPSLRSLVLLLAFVPWVAQASMTAAAHLLHPANTTVATPVTCLQFFLVRNHIWTGAVLTSCLCLVVASKIKDLNSALFLDGPLSMRAVDGARQAYGLLFSMISVIDNALGPVVFMWNASFVVDVMYLCLKASSSPLVPMSLTLVNLLLLLVLWLLFAEAGTQLRFGALETIDTFSYKLCEQPELSLSGALACAAAHQQDLGLSCGGLVPVGRSLAAFVFGVTAALSGLALYFKDELDVAKQYEFTD
ncbi:hypothetical protein HPB51_029284 [Rhipicephalus microplus]|uniref:Uncharacterized protein n=1 Tax=Rhipicephalus microplus TaxID=6941 RepID=A0A9J6CV03_RHIMP|nr:hypothetical protein HPB51_029284 [Rhipicephalus microplus]